MLEVCKVMIILNFILLKVFLLIEIVLKKMVFILKINNLNKLKEIKFPTKKTNQSSLRKIIR